LINAIVQRVEVFLKIVPKYKKNGYVTGKFSFFYDSVIQTIMCFQKWRIYITWMISIYGGRFFTIPCKNKESRWMPAFKNFVR